MALGVGAAVGQQIAAANGRPAAPEPPPLPTVAWYYAVGTERRGPVDEAGLRASGAITRDTLVWRAGMANWAAAGTVPDLADLLPK